MKDNFKSIEKLYIHSRFIHKTATMENSVQILKKLGIELPYNPAIPLLGIHPEETRIEVGTCTPMFISALFTIARTWTQHVQW